MDFGAESSVIGADQQICWLRRAPKTKFVSTSLFSEHPGNSRFNSIIRKKSAPRTELARRLLLIPHIANASLRFNLTQPEPPANLTCSVCELHGFQERAVSDPLCSPPVPNRQYTQRKRSKQFSGGSFRTLISRTVMMQEADALMEGGGFPTSQEHKQDTSNRVLLFFRLLKLCLQFLESMSARRRWNSHHCFLIQVPAIPSANHSTESVPSS